MTLSNNPNQRMEFQDRPTTPVMTMLLCLLTFGTYAMMKLSGPSTRGPEFWLSNNCYSLPRMQALMDAHKMPDIGMLFYNSTFSSFHPVQMGFSLYFFWVFGKHVEQKLGPGRFIILLFLGLTVPYAVLNWLTMRMQSDAVFVGPMFILCALLGTYMVFPPVPKSKIGRGETFNKKEGIFRKGGRPDPLDKYIGNPWMFVVTFVVIQGLEWFWVHLQKPLWIFTGIPGLETFSALPCVAAAGIGWLIGYMLEQQATANLKESPMTLQAVKRYHELLDLDVNHEEALRGTALTLGLPYDKVKQWVAKNRGSMRIK